MKQTEKQLQDLRTFRQALDTGTGFEKSIVDAITQADIKNLERLQGGFPELVNGYLLHSKGVDWSDYKVMVDLRRWMEEEEQAQKEN